MSDHVVLYVHGFGVRKDSRGMFTDIVGVLPEFEHVLVDLTRASHLRSRPQKHQSWSRNTFSAVNDATASPPTDKTIPEPPLDASGNGSQVRNSCLNGIAESEDMVVGSLESQAKRLTATYERIRSEHPDAALDLICHSQGCIIAGLAHLPSIHRILLLAPPSEAGTEGIQRLFSLRPSASSLDMNGVSKLARADGSTTTVAAEYWASLDGIEPMKLYEQLCADSDVQILSARDDEILKNVDFTALQGRAEILSLPGNHNFTGFDRGDLLEAVQRKIMQSR